MDGVVTAFDEPRGLGTIDADGTAYPFHCTALLDGTRTVAVGRRDLAEAALLVERRDGPGAGAVRRHGQWTIFDSGSSMMSLAPASLRAGMSVLMAVFSTTVSTA